MKKTIIAVAAIAVLSLTSCKETPSQTVDETSVEEILPVVEEAPVVEEVEVDSTKVEETEAVPMAE